MEAILPLIIQAVSGMVGGGIAGGILKQAAMSMLPKLLAGGIGGIAGGSALGSIIGGAAGAATGDVGGGLDADGNGWGVAGSVAINESWYAFATYSSAELVDVIDLDQMSIGAGWHSAINDTTDWFVSAAYVDAEISAGQFGSADDSGFGLSVGMRSMLNPNFELAGSLNYVDFGDGDDTSLGISGWYTVTGNLALGLGAEFGDDISSYGLGIRLYFDK